MEVDPKRAVKFSFVPWPQAQHVYLWNYRKVADLFFPYNLTIQLPTQTPENPSVILFVEANSLFR